MLIARDDSAIAWAKRKDALRFARFRVDRIPTPVLEECMKAIRQRGAKREEVLLEALMELYQNMPQRIPAKELSDLDSYRRWEEIRSCSNKELTVTKELLERIRNLKVYAKLGKQISFQYVPGVPGMANNPFVNEEARDSYFVFEQAVILDFLVDRVREIGMIKSEQLQLEISFDEHVVEPLGPKLEGQVRFECGSWDGPLKTSLVMMWELMKPSWCPNLNADLIWDLTADVELGESDDESLHDLAMIHHLLALKVKKQSEKTPTELSLERNFPSIWMRTGECLVASCGL